MPDFKIKYWLMASRPKTLFAALSPVLLGSAAAYRYGKLVPDLTILAVICSLLIQIGTNFVNDLFDYMKGTDDETRTGPVRVVSAGFISPKQMKFAIYLVFGLAFLLGLIIVYKTDFFVLIIGVLSLLAGYSYTAGPYPLAYNGLGDLFVFIFFGIVAVCGTFYINTQMFTADVFLLSLTAGALITNILVVNNYRDYETDKIKNKKTLAVLIGKNFTYYQYISMFLISFIIPLVLYFTFNYSIVIFSVFILIPLAVKNSINLYQKKSTALNKVLAETAAFSFIHSVVISLILIL